MTLQQLQYIISLDNNKHFLNAAEECGVTQPTLSAMIQKLEDELDVKLFDRSHQPLTTTEIGKEIIAQAKIVLKHAEFIKEMIKNKRESLEGSLNLAIIPTIAPSLLPKFLIEFRKSYPKVDLQIQEMKTSDIVLNLNQSKIDMGILATPLEIDSLLEIPVYYEKFFAYISPKEEIYKQEVLSANNMPLDNLWILQEGHCLREQVFNFCIEKRDSKPVYEAGSIDTLIKIIDENGGYTVIPELHLQFLNDHQLKNIRNIEKPQGVREVSIVITNDFIRERLLNAVVDTVKSIVPDEMIDQRLKKFAIRL
ncbi:MAG: LysR substrate-binding domain-containing protein [Bacteroidales bacterium]|nr:LysR substrate-binding domain-containing protein [Bacteroidales bacterium]